MSKTNKSQYAVLGILGLGPHSGYDIKKLTELSTRHFWAENYGSLYPALKRLEQGGLATVESQVQDGKPDRKVYTITSAGREVLTGWLEQRVNETPPRSELLLKLFLGRQTAPEVSVRHLERFYAEQTDLIATYKGLGQWLETEQAGDPNLPYWLLTLSYGRVQAEALKNWSEVSLETLQNLSQQKESLEGAHDE